MPEDIGFMEKCVRMDSVTLYTIAPTLRAMMTEKSWYWNIRFVSFN